MKAHLTSLTVMTGSLLIGYSAETNQVDLVQTETAVEIPYDKTASTVRFERRETTKFLGVEVTQGGVLPEAARNRAQFFSPAYQGRYKDYQNISVNPVTGRIEGILLWSIKF